ncbi:putative capsid protein [Odonata-associated circular virus-16]|uniref:putative capsid protein n=1 Tax=Odonata-associated circular virus-16 TaxID=1592116 RepID=UPI00058628FA|nr:putative capsid protein [Odonata-associated circular virus-16]AJD07513.1 putative capsid protein [Odonata-associated circular virus-16]
MVRSRSRSRTSYRKKVSVKRRVPRTRKGVTVPVKKYVQKAIHRQIENKCVQFNGAFTMVNYADDNTMRGFALSPGTSISIAQGTGSADRTGNRIKIIKGKLVYWMVPTAYNGLLNPQPKPLMVRLWIGYSKTNPTLIPPAGDQAVLFQNGNTASPPNGFINDMLRSVNKDKFVIFRDIKHKLGYESITGTGFVAGSQYFANNDFKFNIMRTIDITKYLINNVIYNDTTAIPTSRGLFCWVQIVYADNNVTTGTIPANFNYFVDLTYEDA